MPTFSSGQSGSAPSRRFRCPSDPVRLPRCHRLQYATHFQEFLGGMSDLHRPQNRYLTLQQHITGEHAPRLYMQKSLYFPRRPVISPSLGLSSAELDLSPNLLSASSSFDSVRSDFDLLARLVMFLTNHW
jgi:hypothetical protein